MAIQQIRAEVQAGKGLQATVNARSLSFLIDEPPELGGDDEGPNPIEVLLGALGACQSIVARIYAKDFGVQLDDLRIELEADIDLDGFLQKADVRPGLSTVRYNYVVESASPQENIDKLFAHVEKFCPVGDTIANPVQLVLNKVVVNPSTQKVVA